MPNRSFINRLCPHQHVSPIPLRLLPPLVGLGGEWCVVIGMSLAVSGYASTRKLVISVELSIRVHGLK